MATVWARVGPQAHLDPLGVGVEARDVLERVRVEVGVELAVEHAQHVAVELGGHAGGVVVGGDEAVDVLDQVGAEEEGVAGRERRRPRSARNVARGAGARLPMVLPRNATSRVPPVGRSVEVVLEVADDRVDVARRAYSRATAAAASRQGLLADVERHEAVERARRRASASSSIRVFSDVPEPSSTSVSASVSSAMSAAWRDEDRALGAGRVVLGEPGDLVEELAARGRRRTTSAAASSESRSGPARRRLASARATSSGCRCTSTTTSAVMGLPSQRSRAAFRGPSS